MTFKVQKRRTPEQLKTHVAELVETLKAKPGRAPYAGESRWELKIKCRRVGCVCTHDAPCEAGWIEQGNGMLSACPRCRPEVRSIQIATQGDRQTLQDTIRDPQAREQAQAAHGWD